MPVDADKERISDLITSAFLAVEYDFPFAWLKKERSFAKSVVEADHKALAAIFAEYCPYNERWLTRLTNFGYKKAVKYRGSEKVDVMGYFRYYVARLELEHRLSLYDACRNYVEFREGTAGRRRINKIGRRLLVSRPVWPFLEPVRYERPRNLRLDGNRRPKKIIPPQYQQEG